MQPNLRMKFSLLLTAVLTAFTAFTQPLPLDTAIHVGRLPNGFTYIIRRNTEPANRVQFYLVNKVGSVLEEEDQRGLAHFMEHMSFNGTIHYPKNELVHYLQKSGVRFGADLNAYTSFDETVYQLPIPTDDTSIMRNGLQIMRDWAGNATLDVSEINDERGVVLEEKRLGKGAQERMRDKTFPVILNNSRYAVRLPIGTDTVLNNFQRPVILKFYKDWYRPDLQALIVVGDINVDTMIARITALFSDLKNPENERPRTKYSIPLDGKNQFIAVTDKEFPYTVIEVLIKRKSMPQGTKEEYIESVKRGIFNEMLATRLAELSQKPNPPFIQAGADADKFLGDLDAFTVFVVAKPGQLQNSFVSVWELIQQAKQFGFTQPEFDRAKVSMISNLESAVREKDKRNSADLVQEYTRYFLVNEPSPGIEVELQMTKDYLNQATLEEINALSTQYISDSNRDVVIMAPQKDSAALPVQASVNGWIASVAQMKLTPYADQFKTQALIGGNISAGKVVSENKIPTLGVTTLTLSNGVKVILKPTDFKNDEIRFEAFSPGGTSLYSDADFQSASASADLIDNMGIAQFTPTDLEKLLSGKKLSVDPYIADRSEGITGSSTPKDLETALQLVYLYFTAPRKDSALFNNFIEQSTSAIANRYNDPKNVFADTVAAVLGDYNVRRTGPSIKKLQQINLEKVMKIYKERFANAGDFTFIFDGNFNVDSLRPLLEKYLGSLPSNTQKEQARDLHIHIPPGHIEATAKKGKDPMAIVRLVISGDYKYSPESNMQLTALSEILQFRITDRLREKEGGTYSPSVRVSYNKYPANRYAYTIQFACAPTNVNKLIAAAKDEINKIKVEGVTDQDITKFNSEETRQYELQLKDNGFWMAWLTKQYENGDNPEIVLQYPALIKQVTPASVKSTANLYLNEKNFIKLLLIPD
jgi:zinc protease